MRPIRRRLMTGLRLTLVAAAVLLIGLLVRPQPAGAGNVRTPAPACANGTVVADPVDHPELVKDCQILLGLRDELAGSATLNWSASLPISDWEGITVDQRNLNAPLRVTALKLRDGRLAGTLPPALGGLSGLRVLWLSHNQLTGSIPPELGNLTTLTELRLAGNQLSGSIPVELAEIGPQLERLDLSGPQPLPSGIGLTGRIPPQLGNLSGLQSLHLEGNRLSGPIPTRLGRLTNLQGLHLQRNQLSGAIPTQLGALTMLDQLRLADNQLVSTIPTQFINTQLQRLYLTGNTIRGCLPYWLGPGFLQYGDMARLNLPDCVGVQPETPVTPLPSYTLSATAGDGGAVALSAAGPYEEAAAVTLRASWNDATHTFAGWSGACTGSATSCALEMYADETVAASFTELPAGRCATPSEADCIRAVYLGAPGDYAQVQDIPAQLLLQPDANGRYPAAPGEQITVVTAAPLPALHDRFLLVVNPLGATTLQQLVQPIGTSYTFTPSGGLAAGDELRFDLRAARSRPGGKPIPGPVIVTTRFERPPEPLTLELSSSRELCTAGTLTELSWTISGGIPPYSLTIDGQPVDAEADSHRVNCGPIPIDLGTGSPVANPIKVFSATVTDAQSSSDSARDEVAVDLVPPLRAPSNVRYSSYVADVPVHWDPVPGAGLQSPVSIDPDNGNRVQITGGVRTRTQNGAVWTYHVVPHRTASHFILPAEPGLRVFSVVAVRHPLELETPASLNWSPEVTYAATTEAENVVITATHDTVSVSWDRQPYARNQEIRVRLAEQLPFQNYFRSAPAREEEGVAGRHEVTFAALEPATDYKLAIIMIDTTAKNGGPPAFDVRTKAAPPDWAPPPTGAQNLRVMSSDVGYTVTWESPSQSVARSWVVRVENVISGNTVFSTFTHGATRWVVPHNWLLSSTRYRITIVHFDIERSERSIEFTTPAAVTSGQADARTRGWSVERSALDFFPVWPVALDTSYAMTDDPFQWRHYTNQNRFHAGLDIGEHHRGAATEDQVDGEPVYAVADGIMRVFADDLSTKSVMYCPENRPLHCQLYVVDNRPGSVWRDPHVTDPLNPEPADQVYCQSLVTPNGGRTALIAHTLPDGTWVVTKYGHLQHDGFPREVVRALETNFDECDPSLQDRQACTLDSDRWVQVSAGEHIARVGASSEGEEDGGFDAHVHFEIRHLDIPESEWNMDRGLWYLKADNCGKPYQSLLDCTWSGAGPRTMATVLDAEAYLPPPPASILPRDVGCHGNTCTDPGPIASSNLEEHVIEIASVTPTEQLSFSLLDVALSIALWRPSFYTRYSGNLDPLGGQPSRTFRVGIASTGPGVDSYHTNMTCGVPPADLPNDPNLPIVPDFPDLPTIDVRMDAPILSGDPLLAGELPRELRSLRLSLNPPCQSSRVAVRASNEHWEAKHRDQILNRADQSITMRDPSASISWCQELAPGGDQLSLDQTLVGNDLDLFTFRAVPGYTYQFCTTQGASSTVCEDETSEQNAAELLIVGPAEPGESGLVEEGPELVRDANGLAWTVPASDLQVETYAVVVRRRARYEGEELPDYTYRLRYTVPDQPACDRGMPTQIYCKPNRPTANDTENITESEITITFGESYRATRYESQLTRTGGVPVVRDVGGADTRSATLDELDPNVEYTIRVRGRNVVGAGAWSNAVMATTLQGCSGSGNGVRSADVGTCPAIPTIPINVQVADVTGTSAELSWDAGDSDLSYDVRAVTGADCKTDVDAQVEMRQLNTTRYELTMLNATMDYLLCVRAVRTTGTAPNELTLRSDWASAPSKPEPPANARVTDRTTSSLTLSWTEVSGFSYKVQIDSGGELTGVSNSPHTFSLLAEGSRHTLQVRAIRGTLESDWTQPLTGTTLTTTTPPPPPSCPSPRPMQPPPQGNRVTLSTSYKWVERGTTAHQQVTKELRDDYKPHEWQGHPDCIWQLASAWVEGTPYTDGPRDTGQSEDKPTEIDKESAGTKLRWVEGPSEACEYEDELERRRTRTVSFSMTNAWDEGPWGPWGARYVLSTEATGNCLAKPTTSYTVTLSPAARQTQCVLVGGAVYEQARTTSNGTQQRRVTWDPVGKAWDTQDVGAPVPNWSGSTWANTGTTWVKPADDVVQVLLESRTETRWTPVDDGLFCIEYEEQRMGTRHSYYFRPHV